jgi:putative ABC transport system permease protein
MCASCSPASSPAPWVSPAQVIAGRPLLRSHYEAVADEKAGLALGDTLRIRRHDYTVVGLARRATSSSGDPMIYIPLKDAQEVQFLKDNDSLVAERARTAANPALNRPGVPGLLDAVLASQTTSHNVNAVLLRVAPGYPAEEVKAEVGRWKHLTAWTRADMEDILVARLIATSSKQIGMFLVILAVVSAAIVAFIIYTMTLNKQREIAVLKLIGTQDRSIAAMILQQALALGLIGYRRRPDIRHPVGAVLPQACPAGARRCRAGLCRHTGRLRAGQHPGDSRRAARRSGRRHRGLR